MADDLDISLDVSIRAIVEADLGGFRDWYGRARDDSFRRSFERHSLGEVVYLVALHDGKPVGHLGIDLVRVAGAALLWQFGVYPALQSHGIGTAMVSEAERVIAEHGFHTVEIGAETDNPRARALYERLGYVLVTERDDEWILRKNIP